MTWEGRQTPRKKLLTGLNVNVWSPAQLLNSRIYKNITKHAAPWSYWDTVNLQIVEPTDEQVDADGYLTTLPATYYAFSVVEDVSVYGRLGRPVRTGYHTIAWEGTGTVRVCTTKGGAAVAIANRGSFTNPNGYIKLEIIAMSESDPVRNIRILENIFLQDDGNPFYPTFITHLRSFNVLRFDLWYENEGFEGSSLTWANRTQRTAWSYNREPSFGLPLEDIALLCQALRKDLWFCIPAKATVSYLDSLVLFLGRTISGNIYFEFSNETWWRDQGWASTDWLEAQGLALGLSVDPATAQYLAVAYYADLAFRTIRSAAVKHEVDGTRFKYVLGFDKSNTTTIATQLDFERVAGHPFSEVVDWLAMHCYIPLAATAAEMEALVAECVNVDEVYDKYLQADFLYSMDYLESSANTVIDIFGKKAVVYEWNQSWVIPDEDMYLSADYEAYQDLVDACFASSRFAYFLTRLCNEMTYFTDGPVCFFCNMCAHCADWRFGILKDVTDSDRDAFEAVTAFTREAEMTVTITSSPAASREDWVRLHADIVSVAALANANETAIAALVVEDTAINDRIDNLTELIQQSVILDSPNATDYVIFHRAQRDELITKLVGLVHGTSTPVVTVQLSKGLDTSAMDIISEAVDIDNVTTGEEITLPLEGMTGWTGPDGNAEYYIASNYKPTVVVRNGVTLTEGSVASLTITEWGWDAVNGRVYLPGDGVGSPDAEEISFNPDGWLLLEDEWIKITVTSTSGVPVQAHLSLKYEPYV